MVGKDTSLTLPLGTAIITKTMKKPKTKPKQNKQKHSKESFMENQLVNLTIAFPSLSKTAVICCSTSLSSDPRQAA